MDVILGIDLGTTNSEVAVVRDGRPVVLGDAGDLILPSVVGLDPQGKLLVGRAARNQFVLAPERTVRSIKRQMGRETTVRLGDQSYTPQEISAIILRTLKTRAEQQLGSDVSKAVITVPAFFSDSQREATRVAGELAGLEVVRIINEPTAAVLTYDPHPADQERLLVYDLGGGTFDVSIAQVEAGVIEILSSHGDTQLGGDDFDQKLLDHVCDRFQTEHGIDLRQSLAARSRLLAAVEEAKKQLSFDPLVSIVEEFIAEDKGLPLHLKLEVSRDDYEALIEPLVAKTLKCVDDALSDARLTAPQITKVLLVGGATRTPLVRHLLAERLGRPVHSEIEPDLAVAMGAAVQGALIAGQDVGAVLVDITPHTLGIATLRDEEDRDAVYFSPIIERNTALPAVRSEVYTTVVDGQTSANIQVFQGSSEDVRNNRFVGSVLISGLSDVPAPNRILVRLELDLNGILRVTATEHATGLAKQVVIDNMMSRFRKQHQVDAAERLDDLFGDAEWTEGAVIDERYEDVESSDEEFEDDEEEDAEVAAGGGGTHPAFARARMLLDKAAAAEAGASDEDVAELRALAADLRTALEAGDPARVERVVEVLEDLVFYLKGA